jgi:hemolysin activation/secretion protein
MLIAALSLPVAAQDEGGAAAEPPASEAEKPRFEIREYRVEGNTLLPALQIERLLYPMLGPGRTIDDVEAARSSLEQAYRDAGYPTVLVNIPEQSVTGGVVRLQTVEGRIDRLSVTGSRYFSLDRIREQVPSLATGVVPNLATAQEELLALNRASADRTVTPVMRPGRLPGTVEMELKVKDELPLHGSVELNDRYSVDTTKLRFNGMLRYDNLWQREHSLSLTFQTAPQETDELQVWVGTYVVRDASTNNALAVYGVHSESDTAAVGTLGVIGKGDILGLREIVPLKGSETYFHSLTLGVDYKDFSESIELQGADTLNTPIDYIPWSLQYSGTRQVLASRTSFGTSLNFGIRGLGNDPEEFDNKRFGSQPNYLYMRANIEREQELYRGMLLRMRIEGQLTDSPLISNEQFSAGGADSVRGYYESQQLGDEGINYGLELYSPQYATKFAPRLQDLRLLVFADGANLHLREPLPGQAADFELYGAGAGLRLTAFENLAFTLDWARALKELGDVEDNDDRVHASLLYTF